MKTLPWEVLEDVVISACMDDRSTARALSGVSHAVRDSTAPLRFRTLVLRGAHQISRFLAFLDRLDHPVPVASPTWWWLKKKTPASRLTPPVVDVHHLFLADCAEERRDKPPARTDCQDYYEVQPRTTAPTTTSVTYRITTERTWRTASEAATAAVQRLLIRLSPTLQHLCYSKRMAGDDGPVAALLPALVELTCHFAVPAPHHAYSLGDVHHPQDLPALRRLHMVLGKVESHHVHFHGFALPPLLTHFRHSEVEDPEKLLWYNQHKVETAGDDDADGDDPDDRQDGESGEYSAADADDPTNDIRLPSSFMHSPAWSAAHIADSLALRRAKGNITFFTTLTANPKWPSTAIP